MKYRWEVGLMGGGLLKMVGDWRMRPMPPSHPQIEHSTSYTIIYYIGK